MTSSYCSMVEEGTGAYRTTMLISVLRGRDAEIRLRNAARSGLRRRRRQSPCRAHQRGARALPAPRSAPSREKQQRAGGPRPTAPRASKQKSPVGTVEVQTRPFSRGDRAPVTWFREADSPPGLDEAAERRPEAQPVVVGPTVEQVVLPEEDGSVRRDRDQVAGRETMKRGPQLPGSRCQFEIGTVSGRTLVIYERGVLAGLGRGFGRGHEPDAAVARVAAQTLLVMVVPGKAGNSPRPCRMQLGAHSTLEFCGHRRGRSFERSLGRDASGSQ